MKQDADNQEWITAFHQGSEKVFKEIFDSFHARLVFFAYKIIDRQDIAEDIVLEAMGKLHRDRKKFQTSEHITSFLFTVTRHSCLNHLKQVRRKQASHAELKYLANEGHDEVELRIIYSNLIEMITHKMEALPASQRKVMKLAYMEGMGNEEISKELSMPQSTVRVYKVRGMELLQSALTNKDVGISNALLVLLIAGSL